MLSNVRLWYWYHSPMVMVVRHLVNLVSTRREDCKLSVRTQKTFCKQAKKKILNELYAICFRLFCQHHFVWRIETGMKYNLYTTKVKLPKRKMEEVKNCLDTLCRRFEK